MSGIRSACPHSKQLKLEGEIVVMHRAISAGDEGIPQDFLAQLCLMDVS